MDSVSAGYKADQLVSLLAQSQQSASTHNGSSSSGLRQASPFPGSINSNGHHEPGSKKTPLLTHKLNGTEITAVRQLITGERIY